MGRGILKAKILVAKYESKLEFPGQMGISEGRVWIFSGTAQ